LVGFKADARDVPFNAKKKARAEGICLKRTIRRDINF